MTAITFIIITILSLLLFHLGTGKDTKLTIIFIVWQTVIGSLSLMGIFEQHPLAFPVVMASAILQTLLGLKKIDRDKIKVPYLLGLHVLRLPVEIVLYQLYVQKSIPQLMTFEGWNFDIIMGLSAIVWLLYAIFVTEKLHKLAFLTWNFVGLALLANIVIIAILSSPLPIQQLAFEQPNVAVLSFPYSFLPSFVVPAVLMSHVLLIQRYRKAT